MLLQDMVAKLKTEESNKWDTKVKAKEIGWGFDGKKPLVQLGGIHKQYGRCRDLTFMEQAHEQMADKLQIPRRYYFKMLREDSKLLMENITTWMDKEPDREFFIRGQGDHIRAFLSPKYKVINHLDVLDALGDDTAIAGTRSFDLGKAYIDSKRLYLEIIIDTIGGLTKTVSPGDDVKAGLLVTNSETGHSAFSIEPRIYRLVCSNGLVVPIRSGERRRFVHLGKENQLSEVGRMVDATMGEFHSIVEKIEEASFQKVQAGKMFDSLKEKYQWSEERYEKIMENYHREQKSLWGVVNTLTITARDMENVNERIKLERIAGELLMSRN